MQKLRKYLIISLIIVSLSFILFRDRRGYLSEDNILGVYVNNELSDNYPSKDSAMFQKAVCDDANTKVTWDNDNWGLLISNLNKKVKCNLYFYSGQTIFNFDYTGTEQTFVAPVSGTYKVETWGAQGGSYNDIYGGYGGYSVGNIILSKGSNIYINVGGTTNSSHGGYNGGGTGSDSIETNNNIEMVNKYLGGGGATHIASASGSLNSLEAEINNILIVSGAGGGGYYYGVRENFMVNGGHGGGYIGNNGNVRVTIGYTPANDIASTGGNQSNGGSGNNSNNYYSGKFGQGGNGSSQKGTGGGSGFYGGGGTYNVGYSSESGAGGSGYIGNPLLKDKVMYCYNCEESNEESTKTISTTCSEETPTSNCAKKGNGYARITLVSIDE